MSKQSAGSNVTMHTRHQTTGKLPVLLVARLMNWTGGKFAAPLLRERTLPSARDTGDSPHRKALGLPARHPRYSEQLYLQISGW